MVKTIAIAGALGIVANAIVWFAQEKRVAGLAIGIFVWIWLFRALDKV